MMFSDFEKDELWALAQLMKRLTWTEIKDNSKDQDEALLMQNAVFKMAKLLANIGYDPR